MSARLGNWITRPIRRWLERAEAEVAIKRCGGDQVCPWCRRWMNQFQDTRVRDFSDGFLDEIRCGNCQGSSLWKWEIGFIYVCEGEPPPAAHLESGFTDAPWLRQSIAYARARIAERMGAS